MIQILTYKGNEDGFQGNGIKVNRIHDAESLDSFDINVICLQDVEMWTSEHTTRQSIDSINDLESLSVMIDNSKVKENGKFYILLEELE